MGKRWTEEDLALVKSLIREQYSRIHVAILAGEACGVPSTYELAVSGIISKVNDLLITERDARHCAAQWRKRYSARSFAKELQAQAFAMQCKQSTLIALGDRLTEDGLPPELESYDVSKH